MESLFPAVPKSSGSSEGAATGMYLLELGTCLFLLLPKQSRSRPVLTPLYLTEDLWTRPVPGSASGQALPLLSACACVFREILL